MSDPAKLAKWISSVSGSEWRWFVKTLSANDTLANESHQAGPYIPKTVTFELFPAIAASNDLNPREQFPVSIDSHGQETVATAIWYNNKVIGKGTRNEARITGWGGSDSPILDPESTGSICIFAFHQQDGRNVDYCRIWLCTSVEEEDAFEAGFGPVEPGQALFSDSSGFRAQVFPQPPADTPCRLDADHIPAAWLTNFPEAEELVGRSVANLPTARAATPDERLLRRRECEFELFRSVEDAVVLPRVKEGFHAVDLFVAFANSVTNRRKARSGASLELQARTIFDEEALPHSYNPVSEGRKQPDFLFPSEAAYQDLNFSAKRLLMLGVKTTCKDRWRQILNEADRVLNKHLLTLQRGVSLNQFAEMKAANVTLVVPVRYHETFHEDIRGELMSLGDFITMARVRTK